MAIKSPKYFGVEINFLWLGGSKTQCEKLSRKTQCRNLTVQNSIAYKLRQGNSSTSSLVGSLAKRTGQGGRVYLEWEERYNILRPRQIIMGKKTI